MKRVVVITGVSSGIGQACAKRFDILGDTVVALGRTPIDSPNFISCDVSVEAMVEAAFATIKERYGHIDILINNAGYGFSGATELATSEEVHNVFDVNYYGVFYCSKYALPLMSKGAKIINVSSVMALFAVPYRGIYNASKAAVNMLTFSMAMELKASGIQVAAVCPGDVKTNFTKHRIKNYKTNARYGERVKNAAEFVDSKEDKRMPVDKVAKKLVAFANRRKLKPFIIISAKYKFLYHIQKLFPMSTLHFFTEKLFSGKKPVKKQKKG